MKKIYNFNPGPAILPRSALQKCQSELLNFNQTGIPILEISHRSKEFEKLLDDTKQSLIEILNIPDNYDILFLTGGASLQFSMIPMNFLPENGLAEYVLTGSWAEKAFDEASRIGNTKIAGTSKDKNYSYIPDLDQLKPDPGASYIHITSNNTIYGTRWKQFPFYNHRPPVIADMSSDILSRKINIGRFSLIYAGAQKNLGPAGVTVVIIDKNFAENANIHLPSMLAYKTHIDKKSLFNTPPVFAIYFIKLVLDWVKEMGGVEKIESLNLKKAKLLYDLIDSSNGFYQGKAHKEYRSLMNITLSLNDSHLENAFLKAAHKEGFIGLKGHRSLGGIRISIYNSMPLEGIIRLVDFMNRFQHVHM